MAFHGSFKNALLAIGGTRFSDFANSASLTMASAELDSSVVGGTAKRRMPGLTDADVAMTLVWDGAGDAAAFGLVSVAPGATAAMTFAASAVEGARAFLSRACTYAYNPGGSIGDLLTGDVSAKASKVVPGGYLLEPGITERNSAGNTTGFAIAAVGATQVLYAALHVVYIEGTTDSITVTIESDDTGGFGSPTTRITFDTITGTIGARSDWKSVAGAITDTYYRAKWTVTGSPKAKIIVSVGIR